MRVRLSKGTPNRKKGRALSAAKSPRTQTPIEKLNETCRQLRRAWDRYLDGELTDDEHTKAAFAVVEAAREADGAGMPKEWLSPILAANGLDDELHDLPDGVLYDAAIGLYKGPDSEYRKYWDGYKGSGFKAWDVMEDIPQS